MDRVGLDADAAPAVAHLEEVVIADVQAVEGPDVEEESVAMLVERLGPDPVVLSRLRHGHATLEQIAPPQALFQRGRQQRLEESQHVPSPHTLSLYGADDA